MTSAITTGRGARTDAEEPAVKQLCGLLYHACLQKPEENYTQAKLLGLQIIPRDDVNLLLSCVNALCDQRRFKHASVQNTDCWQVVRGEDTARYKGLNQDESVVLVHIDDSQREGIWVRHIRSRSNLAQNTVNNALKKLEQRGIVKQVTNVKYPARKHYMLAHLQPSEEVTGGPFFSEGILDEDFVYNLSKVIYDFVTKRSWDQQISDSDILKRRGRPVEPFSMRPMPPGHSGFPTIADISKYVNEHEISSVRLTEPEIRNLLDLLCWDGYMTVTADEKGYRSIKAATRPFEDVLGTNGYVETPCGNCPVSDWCEDSGPVNSKTCVYLDDWLKSE